MTNISIRRADAADSARLAHIGVATFIDSYVFDIDGEAIIAHCTRQHSEAWYAECLAAPDNAAWLAEYEATGAPVGYALLCRPDLPVACGEDDLELKRIYVLSRFHGGPSGSLLMEAVIAEARRRGAGRLLLGTYEDNHRAIAFYRKNGFELAGTRQFQVGHRIYDDIVLARQL